MAFQCEDLFHDGKEGAARWRPTKGKAWLMTATAGTSEGKFLDLVPLWGARGTYK
jgi:hypothetical protein